MSLLLLLLLAAPAPAQVDDEAPLPARRESAVSAGAPDAGGTRATGAGLGGPSDDDDKPRTPRGGGARPSSTGSAVRGLPALAGQMLGCAPSPEPPAAAGFPRIADMLLAGLGDSRSSVARAMIRDGKYLYVSGEPGLQTIDASDPESLRMTSDWKPSSAKMNGAAIKGRTLYVANWTPAVGLVVFDLSNPAAPAHVRTLATPRHAWEAVVTGNLLDVTVGDETGSALVTYDVSNPREPRVLGTVQIDDRLMGSASRHAGHLYFTHKEKLFVYAGDPASPRRVRELPLEGLGGNSLARSGRLYVLLRNVGAGQKGGVKVFSLDDPANPRPVGFWENDEPRSMSFDGDRLLVPAAGSGNYLLDVSGPSPRLLAHFHAAWPGTGHGGYPVAAALSGRLAFLGTTGGNNPGCETPACACYGARVYSVFLTAPPR